jgi:hypothetical protein
MTDPQLSANPPPAPRSHLASWLPAGLLVACGVAFSIFWLMRNSPSSPTNDDSKDKSGAVQSPPDYFRDATEGSGVDFTYRNGDSAKQYTILETLGGGVALIDYDRDGWLDLFVTGGGYFDGPNKQELKGYPCKLYRNLGNWKFQDVTEETGLNQSWWYTQGVAVADYDRDGWPDLVVTGYGKLLLFHNESNGKGGRLFKQVEEEFAPKDHSWSTSAGWADIDGDGYPDLYVCHYLDWSFSNNPICQAQVSGVERDICPPQMFKPLVHALFMNEKGKKFRDVAMEQGFQAAGCGLGVVLADINDDGRPDIYVANDITPKFLYFNRGGKLEERAGLAGVAFNDLGKYDGSMGVDVADYDGSGRASLWLTNFQGDVHALSRNLGAERFLHQSRATGIAAIGSHYVGFGTGFIDIDNDGWEDLVIVNGHVHYHPSLGNPFKQRPVLLHNIEFEGRRFFQEISKFGGPFFQTPALGRGLAIGDLDNDGFADIVVSNTNSPVVLLHNEATSVNPWLGLKLTGKKNRDIVGSTAIVDAGNRKLTRFVKGGGSYLSANDPRLLVGLGSSGASKKVTVKWSWGGTQTWEGLEANSYWELREGDPTAKRINYSGK